MATPIQSTPGSRGLRGRLAMLSVLDRFLGPGAPSDTRLYRARERLTATLNASHPLQDTGWRIPELSADQVDTQTFARLSCNYTRPVVMRGLWAASAAVRRWTREYLSEVAGDSDVVVLDYSKADPDNVLNLVPPRQMRFADFLGSTDSSALYMNNSTQLFATAPVLFDELEVDGIEAHFGGEARATNFFIGGTRVYSALHCAIGGNFSVQVAGRKEWVLMAPKVSPYVLPVFVRPFIYALSPYAFQFTDPDHALHLLPHHRIVLEPGDVLFNPPWWWHEVRNLDDFTIGCAVRWGVKGAASVVREPSWRTNGLFSAMSVLPLLEARYQLVKLRGMVVEPSETYAQSLNRVLQGLILDGLAKMNPESDSHSR